MIRLEFQSFGKITFFCVLFYWAHSYTSAQVDLRKDYIVTRKGDTVNCVITKTKLRQIKCLVRGGSETVYKASQIRGYKIGNHHWDAGFARLMVIGWKRPVFLLRIKKGKLCLYGYTTTQSRTIGTARADVSAEFEQFQVTVYYARKLINYNGKFQKLGMSWRRNLHNICYDCPKFLHHIYDQSYWQSSFKDEVDFYNNNCGDK